MHQNLFFNNIEQAVCLVTKLKADVESINGLHIDFNTTFQQIFSDINETNIFDQFGHEFEQFVFESLSKEVVKNNLDLSYQNVNFLIIRQKISSAEIAFLFKKQGNNEQGQPIALSGSVGISDEMNFDVSTFEDAVNIVVITDITGKVEYVNKKFTAVTGYTFDEAIGNSTRILKSGKQTNDFYKQMWETILKGQIWNNSFHNKKKSGQLYWQRTQIIPLRDNAGNVKWFLALAEDVTEGKAFETVMEEKSDLLFQLIEGTPDIVCVKDGEGRWLMANSSNIKLFELEGVNYYGKTTLELSDYSSFYKDALISCMNSDFEAWDAKNLIRRDEVIPLPDGGEIILDTLKIPSFNPDGSRKRIIVIGRDVTIRKKAIENLKQIERRYALAQRAGGIVSWEWDLERLTLNWVDNLEEIFGDSKLFDNKGFKDVLEYIHPEDRFLFLRKMMEAIQNSAEYDFDIRVYDIKNNVKWVKFSGHIHYDELRAKSLLFGIIYDITERKNYVRDIIQAKLKAEESDRLKSTFLATMSHELRTPLNAVIGFSDLIMGTPGLDAEINEFVRLINNNGQNLLNLIEDIFDLSLIESNQVKIYKAKFDLVQVLQELAEIMPVEIKKFNKIDKLEFKNELPNKQIILDSDASRITQIISNLLKNAIKFTPNGYVKLGIIEEESDVIVYVEDSGIGINKDKQEIIFDIFRQGEETLTRKFGGAGLGLSLSNNLTDLLGGKLWVESVEGKGSVFFFKIGKYKNGYEKTVKNNIIMQTIDWSDKYVLIAEDEYSNYELLMYILKPTKIRVKQVTNGNDAVSEVLNIERPDIILMDIKMPELNGFEATKSIKEVYPDLPIIAQTAFAISGDREMALSMGCDEYISKPIKKLDLIELMKKYLS
ncbi:MAG: PAS domain S-box protein [Bacteroidales bacterium]|nr:PAS domain S-box protein [Bacteroidales bacterium]